MSSPIAPEEEAKIREQLRDFERERFLLASKVYSEHVLAHRMNAISNVREYGTLSIKTLFLLNGGAILALLSFIAALISKTDERQILLGISVAHSLRPAFYCFITGIVLTGLLAGIAYLNWSAVFQSWQGPSHLYDLISKGEAKEIKPFAGKFADRTTYLAIGVALISLIFFATGAYYVADALHVIGG